MSRVLGSVSVLPESQYIGSILHEYEAEEQMNHLIDQTINQTIDRSMNQSFNTLNRAMNPAFGHFATQVYQSNNPSNIQSINQTNNQPINQQTINQPNHLTPPIQRSTSAPPQLDFDAIDQLGSPSNMHHPQHSEYVSHQSINQSSIHSSNRSNNQSAHQSPEHSDSQADTITVNGEVVLLSDPRLSYEYFNWFYSQRPLDPRLPPPLINWSTYQYAEQSAIQMTPKKTPLQAPIISKGELKPIGSSMMNHSNNQSNNQTINRSLLNINHSNEMPINRSILNDSNYQSTSPSLFMSYPSINQTIHQSNNQTHNFNQASPVASAYYLPQSPMGSPLVEGLGSINQSISQVMNQAINSGLTSFADMQKSFNSLNLRTSPPFQPMNHSIDQSVNHPVGESSQHQARNPMLAIMGFGANAYRGQSDGANNQSNNQSVNQPNNQTGNHSKNQTTRVFYDTAPSPIVQPVRSNQPISQSNNQHGWDKTHPQQRASYQKQNPINKPIVQSNNQPSRAPFHPMSPPRVEPTFAERSTILSSINQSNIHSINQSIIQAFNEQSPAHGAIKFSSNQHIPLISPTLVPLNNQSANQTINQTNNQSLTSPGHSARSAWLDDFRLNKANERAISMQDLIVRGVVLDLSCDQHGSRFIQQRLESASPEERSAAFSQLIPSINQLCQDVFGNYVIQKLFEYGTPEQRSLMVVALRGKILQLSLHTYGCRVIQKALETSATSDQALIVRELTGHVVQCVKDASGNHVIQKCIERCPSNLSAFVYSAFAGSVATLSVHAYGCRVVQRLLEHANETQRQAMLSEILASSDELCRNQFGNYVIQHVLIHGSPAHRSRVVLSLRGKLLTLSKHKFASNVIEKCFAHASRDDRQALIDEVMGEISPITPGGESAVLLGMVKDQFANYVVQRLIDVLDQDQLEQLVTRIHKFVPQLRKIPYGKHIIAKIERMTGRPI